MTHEQRLHGLIFNGLQEFDGKFPPYGVFTDPVTKSSFSVALNEPIGPALDKLRMVWEEDLTEQTPEKHEFSYECAGEGCQSCRDWMADVAADQRYQDSIGS